MSFLSRSSWVLVTAFCLASCGGGGGGGSTAKTTPAVTTTTPAVVNSSPVETLPSDTALNAIPVTVAAALGGTYPNILYATVTICAPNTTNCVAIPNVQVDTGSTGLRLVASAIGSTVLAGLGVQTTDGTASTPPAAECGQFADGVTWGSVRTATVTLGSLSTTTAVPIQVILDQPNQDANVSSTPPTSCTTNGTAEQTSTVLGANGIIGVGYFLQDCGPGCATAGNGFYYDCPSSDSCEDQAPASAVTTANQVSNPVASLPTGYNNGDIIQLPAVPPSGAASASGYLILGLGSSTNNQLPGTPIGLDPNYGYFSVAYNGTPYTSSFLDSGSSVYFFNNSALATCSAKSIADGFFCPSASYSGSATITAQGTNPSTDATTFAFNFTVANALTLFDTYPNAYAFNNLGAPAGSESLPGGSFDMGLPYFFGNQIYTGFEPVTSGMLTAGYPGPYAAVSPAP